MQIENELLKKFHQEEKSVLKVLKAVEENQPIYQKQILRGTENVLEVTIRKILKKGEELGIIKIEEKGTKKFYRMVRK